MLKVHTRHLGNIAVVCLQGQVVKGETDRLLTTVQSQSRAGAVLLDFARVTTVDAGGLGVLLELRAQALAKGIRFALMNLSPNVRLVLRITRLDSIFEVASGMEFFPVRNERRATTRLAPCA